MNMRTKKFQTEHLSSSTLQQKRGSNLENEKVNFLLKVDALCEAKRIPLFLKIESNVTQFSKILLKKLQLQ